jgi:hypothetical protein
MNELKRDVGMLREALELEKKKEKSAPCSLFSVCLPLEDLTLGGQLKTKSSVFPA